MIISNIIPIPSEFGEEISINVNSSIPSFSVDRLIVDEWTKKVGRVNFNIKNKKVKIIGYITKDIFVDILAIRISSFYIPVIVKLCHLTNDRESFPLKFDVTININSLPHLIQKDVISIQDGDLESIFPVLFKLFKSLNNLGTSVNEYGKTYLNQRLPFMNGCFKIPQGNNSFLIDMATISTLADKDFYETYAPYSPVGWKYFLFPSEYDPSKEASIIESLFGSYLWDYSIVKAVNKRNLKSISLAIPNKIPVYSSNSMLSSFVVSEPDFKIKKDSIKFGINDNILYGFLASLTDICISNSMTDFEVEFNALNSKMKDRYLCRYLPITNSKVLRSQFKDSLIDEALRYSLLKNIEAFIKNENKYLFNENELLISKVSIKKNFLEEMRIKIDVMNPSKKIVTAKNIEIDIASLYLLLNL